MKLVLVQDCNYEKNKRGPRPFTLYTVLAFTFHSRRAL